MDKKLPVVEKINLLFYGVKKIDMFKKKTKIKIQNYIKLLNIINSLYIYYVFDILFVFLNIIFYSL